MTQPLSALSTELVSQAVAGDRRAVERIVRALEGPVYAVALRMLLEPQDAEDATQEALIRIVTRLAQFRGEARFSTWALRIAINRIVDFRAQRGPRFSFEQFSDDLQDGLDPEASERPEDAALLRQLRQMCQRAMLQCLDQEHRIAFVLGEILELSSVEAAEVLEIAPAAFRKRLSRARAALSAFLHAHCSVVGEQAGCACHRRLTTALSKGRVQPDQPEQPGEDVRDLRARLKTLPPSRRVQSVYRGDAERESTPDFSLRLRAILSRFTD